VLEKFRCARYFSICDPFDDAPRIFAEDLARDRRFGKSRESLRIRHVSYKSSTPDRRFMGLLRFGVSPS
jgi:hypothetical protein